MATLALTVAPMLSIADEVEWLVATLRAIDLGILRIGSSKSSGRLCLKEAPVVRGEDEFAEMFRDLVGSA